MDTREPLIKMLRQLLEDMMVLYQQGAGYYSCIPIIRRYNKLLATAKPLFPDNNALIETFEPIAEKDPNDPADKMTIIQGIRVEIGQLVTLLESKGEAEDRSSE